MKLIKTIWVVLILILLFVLYFFNTSEYYDYIMSVEVNDYRYSLYKHISWEVNQIIIFRHGIDYLAYTKVETSKISLGVLNGNQENEYLYDLYLDILPDSELILNLLDERYIVFQLRGVYYFVFDTQDNVIVFQALLESEGVRNIKKYKE